MHTLYMQDKLMPSLQSINNIEIDDMIDKKSYSAYKNQMNTFQSNIWSTTDLLVSRCKNIMKSGLLVTNLSIQIDKL